MAFSRSAGIILHPTSLPSAGGIGSLGHDARRFVDVLVSAGIRLWQILPLAPTGYGDSPYAGHSAFAGNTMLIDLEILHDQGWLTEGELLTAFPPSGELIEYGLTVPQKTALLRRAFERFQRDDAALAEANLFSAKNKHWLDDFALFMALKDQHGLASWEHWEPELRFRDPAALSRWAGRLEVDIAFHRFTQAVFAWQWADLKQYAEERGVLVVGDMPIFVAYDSADVWAHPDEFRLNANRLPEFVAGVPPDYFSPTGQLWGNPQYRWEVMEANNFQWWVARFRALRERVDIIRLDHFRGLAGAWWIPYGRQTAEVGEWVPSPGKDLLEAVRKELGDLPIIAEDLGVITPDVIELRQVSGFPGMRVLQFAFGTDAGNESLPHNFERNTCAYTGTHDNDTTVGWFDSIMEEERRHVERYLGEPANDVAWQLLRLSLGSVADLAIFPMQDFLRLGSEARMNLPGTSSGNWRWRFRWEDIREADINDLRDMVVVYGR